MCNHQILGFFLKSFARNKLHFVIAALLTLLLLVSIRPCWELGALERAFETVDQTEVILNIVENVTIYEGLYFVTSDYS